MKTMTIRNIPVDVHLAIKRRAVEHGHSTEQEVRIILSSAASIRPPLVDALLDCGARLQSLSDEVFEVPGDKRPMTLESFD